MTKEEYLKTCAAHWDKFEPIKGSKDLFELELKTVVAGGVLVNEILQAQVGKIPGDRRKKT